MLSPRTPSQILHQICPVLHFIPQNHSHEWRVRGEARCPCTSSVRNAAFSANVNNIVTAHHTANTVLLNLRITQIWVVCVCIIKTSTYTLSTAFLEPRSCSSNPASKWIDPRLILWMISTGAGASFRSVMALIRAWVLIHSLLHASMFHIM